MKKAVNKSVTKKAKPGRKPKIRLSDSKIERLLKMRSSGKYTYMQLAEKFNVSYAAVYYHCKKL